MVKLSVNINKIATLRNARGGNNPDLLKMAMIFNLLERMALQFTQDLTKDISLTMMLLSCQVYFIKNIILKEIQ